MSGTVRYLSAADVVTALPMADAIEGMKSAYAQVSAGTARVPLRARVESNGTTLVMPAYLPDSDDLAIKIVSVFPGNIGRGIPTIHAMVIALDPETGVPLAIMEGSSLTAIRTGAGAGAATDLLARKDAKAVAIIGSGVQARTQLEAVCSVRDVAQVSVYSPTAANAAAFAEAMAGHGKIPGSIYVASSPEEAIQDADIICAATTSKTPVFDGNYIKPGAHVNGVGSFTPQMQEVDVVTIKRSLVVIDSLEAVMEEAGDLLVPLESGKITQDHIHAELGEIILGQKEGRISNGQVTYFKSVGVAAQDAVSASIAYTNAVANNLGTSLSL